MVVVVVEAAEEEAEVDANRNERDRFNATSPKETTTKEIVLESIHIFF